MEGNDTYDALDRIDFPAGHILIGLRTRASVFSGRSEDGTEHYVAALFTPELLEDAAEVILRARRELAGRSPSGDGR